MAWQTPVTTWGQAGQTVPGVTDFNRIEENIRILGQYDRAPGYGVANGTNAKTITLNPAPGSYYDGLCFAFKNATQNTGAVTINVNGMGARPIKKSNGNDLASGALRAGSIYTIRYNSNTGNFILQGEGGEYGTAQPEHVLEGYTIGTENGIVAGTMPNRGAINQTITTQDGQITIPEGYHNGNGIVKAQFANLIPENIRYQITIGGVTGTLGRAKSVANPNEDNRWLLKYAYTNLMSGDEVPVGSFKPNVAGAITVGVTVYHGTFGATGTFYIYFRRNGAIIAPTTTYYMDTVGYETVFRNISVSSNDIIEISARFSGTSSSASVDRYGIYFELEGITPPVAL